MASQPYTERMDGPVMTDNKTRALEPWQIAEAVIAHFDFDDDDFERKLMMQIESDIVDALDAAVREERERCIELLEEIGYLDAADMVRRTQVAQDNRPNTHK